jgi:AraC family transcriptional regulator
MNAVGKAIWFIETHFSRDISLDDVAESAGVSRYHMSRAFSFATGRSVMRYVRGRRLTEAARCLVNGAPDILTVALDTGYGSHEAFTRAFREQFGLTPETVRAQRCLHDIELVEAMRMDETLIPDFKPARFESGRPLLIAGVGERYTCETSRAIPAQWQRAAPSFDDIPRRIGKIAFGVIFNSDDEDNFDYIAGMEVTDFSGLPASFSRLRVGPQKYAVFSIREHISTVRCAFNTIWSRWLPESGHEVADAPWFERYGEEFDPHTGMGGFEIWIPVKA